MMFVSPNNNTTGVTSVAGTAYHSREPEFILLPAQTIMIKHCCTILEIFIYRGQVGLAHR